MPQVALIVINICEAMPTLMMCDWIANIVEILLNHDSSPAQLFCPFFLLPHHFILLCRGTQLYPINSVRQAVLSQCVCLNEFTYALNNNYIIIIIMWVVIAVMSTL